MDYIDWFLKVLTQIVEASRATLQARQFGVSVDEVARALFGADVVDQPSYSQSEQYLNLLHLFEEMKDSGFLEGTKIRALGSLLVSGETLFCDEINFGGQRESFDTDAEVMTSTSKMIHSGMPGD